MEHPGSSCRNVWPLLSKCSQHLKETIQKRGVIFGQVEEAGKQLSAMHSPWSWALVAAGATDKPILLQRSWPGTPPWLMDITHRAMAEGQAGHLVLKGINKQKETGQFL